MSYRGDQNIYPRCDKCEHEIQPKYVTDLEEKFDAEMEDIDSSDVESYLALVDRYRHLLPPSHYLMVIVKRYIFTIYGTKPGLELPRLTDTQLEDKAKFCRSFIRYLGKIDPGYSQGRSSNDSFEFKPSSCSLYKASFIVFKAKNVI